MRQPLRRLYNTENVVRLHSRDENKWMDESQRPLGDRKNKICDLKRRVRVYVGTQMPVQDGGGKCRGETNVTGVPLISGVRDW